MPDKLHVGTDSKLLVSEASELQTGDVCCANSKIAILIYNSNSAKDDNFTVSLNGNGLGQIDNNSHTCTGRIFSTDPALNSANCPDISCGVPNFEATAPLDPAYLNVGVNTLRIESIQDNDNGNFGVVKVFSLCLSGTIYTVSKYYVDSTYLFADGVGNGQDFAFTYP